MKYLLLAIVISSLTLRSSPKQAVINDTIYPVIRNITEDSIQIVTINKKVKTIHINQPDSLIYDLHFREQIRENIYK